MLTVKDVFSSLTSLLQNLEKTGRQKLTIVRVKMSQNKQRCSMPYEIQQLCEFSKSKHTYMRAYAHRDFLYLFLVKPVC